MSTRSKRKKRRVRLRCEQCHARVKHDEYGDHDSEWSRSATTWDGIVIVAWCRYCGWEYASDA